MIAGIVLLMALPFLPGRIDINLMAAARFGDAAVAEVLLHAGADPDARQALTGWTPLTAACFYGHVNAVQVLLRAGADPNATDIRGGTPLMKTVAMPGGDERALTAKKAAILRLLLAAGADPQRKDALGGKAWQTALILDQKEFVDAFAAAGVRGVRETQLLEAIARGDAGAVDSLLAAGADVKYRDEDGWDALGEAALSGNATLLRAVLAHGAGVNARYEKGWTALMIAAHGNHTDAVRELLAAGADSTLRSEDGNTALDVAIAAGCAECASLLHVEP